MPIPSLSSCFVFLLTDHVEEGEEAPLTMPDVYKRLGFDLMPSTKRNTPIPKSLTAEQSRMIAVFMSSVYQAPAKKRLEEAEKNMSTSGGIEWKRYIRVFSPRFNKIMDDALKELGFWPPMLIEGQDDDEFPPSANIVGPASPFLGPILLGAWGSNGLFTRPRLMPCIKGITLHAVSRHVRAWKSARALLCGTKSKTGLMERTRKLMKEIVDADVVKASQLREVTLLFGDIRAKIMWVPGQMTKLQQWEGFIMGILDSHNIPADRILSRMKDKKGIEKVARARAQGSTKKLADVSTPEQITHCLNKVIDHFTNYTDPDEPNGGPGEPIYTEPLDERGDLGVEKFAHMNEDRLFELLGFRDGRPITWRANLPIDEKKSNDSQEPTTANKEAQEGPPVKLKWHQAVGVAAMVDKTFHGPNDPKPLNMLLCDAVGVGKTCQVMAFLGFLQALRVCEESVSNQHRPHIVEGGDNKTWSTPPHASPSWRASIVQGIASHGLRALIVKHLAFQERGVWGASVRIIGCPCTPRLPRRRGLDKSMFMGESSVPDRPHLLVVPNSLVDQWISEVKRFFVEGSVDVFRLPTSATAVSDFFTKEDSPWKTSHQPMCNRLVFCAHSTFGNCTAMHWYTAKRGVKTPPDALRQRREEGEGLEVSIFDILWGLVVCDELHDFKGETSRGFTGIVHIQIMALLLVGVTATPIMNKVLDLLNIARMMGFPYFTLEAGYELARQYKAEHRQAHTLMKNARTDDHEAIIDGVVNGRAIDAHVDPTIHLQAAAYKTIRQWLPHFQCRVIRRTNKSLRYDGNRINDLPTLTEVHIPVRLTAGEAERLDAELQKLKSTASKAVETNWEEFLTGYRVTVAYPFWTPDEHQPTKKTFEEVASLDEWEERRGSKLQTLVRVLQHYLGHDNAAHPFVDTNDSLVYPPHPDVPEGESAPQTRKIMVYLSFTMMVDLFVSVLRVHGINSFSLTGASTPDQRTRIINNFKTSPTHRVLLFTNVGTTGLNMTEANVMIHFDMTWSGVYQEQINGRIWRIGQESDVTVVYIKAFQTTDGLMQHNATMKTSMTKTLWDKQTDPVLEQVLRGEFGGAESEDEDEIEDDPEEIKELEKEMKEAMGGGSSKKRKRKAPPKVNKTRNGIEDDTEDEMLAPVEDKDPIDELPPAKKMKTVVIDLVSPKPKGKARANARPKPKPKPKSKKGSVQEPITIDDDNDEDTPLPAAKSKRKVSKTLTNQEGEGEAVPEKGTTRKRKAANQNALVGDEGDLGLKRIKPAAEGPSSDMAVSGASGASGPPAPIVPMEDPAALAPASGNQTNVETRASPSPPEKASASNLESPESDGQMDAQTMFPLDVSQPVATSTSHLPLPSVETNRVEQEAPELLEEARAQGHASSASSPRNDTDKGATSSSPSKTADAEATKDRVQETEEPVLTSSPNLHSAEQPVSSPSTKASVGDSESTTPGENKELSVCQKAQHTSQDDSRTTSPDNIIESNDEKQASLPSTQKKASPPGESENGTSSQLPSTSMLSMQPLIEYNTGEAVGQAPPSRMASAAPTSVLNTQLPIECNTGEAVEQAPPSRTASAEEHADAVTGSPRDDQEKCSPSEPDHSSSRALSGVVPPPSSTEKDITAQAQDLRTPERCKPVETIAPISASLVPPAQSSASRALAEERPQDLQRSQTPTHSSRQEDDEEVDRTLRQISESPLGIGFEGLGLRSSFTLPCETTPFNWVDPELAVDIQPDSPPSFRPRYSRTYPLSAARSSSPTDGGEYGGVPLQFSQPVPTRPRPVASKMKPRKQGQKEHK